MSDSFFSNSKIVLLKRIRADFAVEVLLTERLGELGINPFKTYLNTLVDILGTDVSESRTLFDETLEWVEKESLPNYIQGINGVFNRPYTFEREHQVEGLDLIEFERIVMDTVRWLIDAPSINLSKRSIKVSGLEQVHAALKYQIPEINIDNVYLTSFVTEPDGRKILQSRSLAEDIFAHFQHDEIPYYHGEGLGVYSVAYSSRESDVHPQLTIKDISDLVIEIAPDFLI
ncbi:MULTISPECIES: hypothetical protein [Pseudomonas]|uniref:Uncharacterized protein n=1 Tax=Pseudomonas fluorescens TaxID=294 RepID=A0A0F4TRZ1_PSEFL|nr:MULTISPECIES: hypothetical protein [Pseudomonas]KJZ46760.1 hypothetical protein VC35_11610 [Pseudomonas fluorescens]